MEEDISKELDETTAELRKQPGLLSDLKLLGSMGASAKDSVYITATYVDTKGGEPVTIEKRGNAVKALLEFVNESRKYANERYKALRVATDTVWLYSWLQDHSPKTNIELIEEAPAEVSDL